MISTLCSIKPPEDHKVWVAFVDNLSGEMKNPWKSSAING